MELIDRKALIDELPNNSMDTMTAYQIGLMILRQPTIPERTAEFRKVHLSYDGDDDDTWECSECKQAWIIDGNPKEHHYQYCPNCGAKFKEADNG